MTLEQKLKSTFDPSKIEPVIINEGNLEITLTKLRLFNEKFYSLKASMRGNSMKDSMNQSMSGSMNDSINQSMSGSMQDLMQDSMKESLWGSVRASIADQMWASIFVNLSKDEYESLFEDKEILETLPFEKVKELCDLYHWFSKQGLFIHRSWKKGDYFLASWKNPKQIQILNIFLGVK